jgi:hypothetical protein
VELFGLFGLILVAALFLWLRDQATTQLCPYCRKPISREAAKCPYCQSNLAQSKSVRVPSPLDPTGIAKHDYSKNAVAISDVIGRSLTAVSAQREQWRATRAARRQERDKAYIAKGVEPGPLAWYRVLPALTQAILLGLTFAVPSTVILIIVITLLR